MELVKQTIGSLLQEAADKWPDRPAIQWEDGMLTWSECRARVLKLASGLVKQGIRRGTHVAFLAPNSQDTFLMMLACWEIGAVTVMCNATLSAAELMPLMTLCDATALVTGGMYKQTNLLETADSLRLPLMPIIDLYADADTQTHIAMATILNQSADEALLAAQQTAVSSDDMAAILFTSGTTSMPKAVPSTHFMRVNNARIQARDLEATDADKFCVTIPLFHCFCISANLLSAVTCGACLCFPRSNRTAELMHTISTMRCTVFTSVPTLFHAMMARPDFDTYDISSLRIGLIGGAAYPAEQFVEIEQRFRFRLMSSLGQTEATAGLTVCNVNDTLAVRSTTVGHFMEHVEGSIRDEQNKALPIGKSGEICIRGYCVMPGYFHAPELTQAAIDADGWLHTGDMGYLDKDGNLHLTGRLKDMVIRGGENIAPAEIELCLIGCCSQIDQIKVVGVPDAHFGEELCACIVLRAGQTITEEDVREAVRSRLAYYKVPKYVVFVDQLPLTASGKIRPAETREMCIELLRCRGELA